MLQIIVCALLLFCNTAECKIKRRRPRPEHRTFRVANVTISDVRFTSVTLPWTTKAIQKQYYRLNGANIHFETGDVNHRSLVELSTPVAISQSDNNKEGQRDAISRRAVPLKHGFLSAVVTAYNVHLPLELSPDDFWLMIAFSVSQHLGHESIAEANRENFVNHTGKKELVVPIHRFRIRPHGDLHSNYRNWPKAIRRMSYLIGNMTNTNISRVLTKRFSTTSLIEQTAYRIALMDTMKNYFEYTFAILCGIPKITLHGRLKDYLEIVLRIKTLKKLLPDFRWYLNRVENHAWEIANTVRGSRNISYWNDMVQVRSDSFGCGQREHFMSGWIRHFVAYHYLDGQLVPHLKEDNGHFAHGTLLETLDFAAVTLTPVMLKDYHKRTNTSMIFSGGFLGVSQNPTNYALRPSIGWMTFYKNE